MKLPTFLLTLGSANAFTLPQRAAPPSTTALSMASVGVFFGTSTGSTEEVADMLVEKLGADGPFDVDDGDSIVETFKKYDSLIVGTPTWNTGADTERSGTGWDELYYGSMESLQLQGKKVAVFGLGDSVSYAENFSDAAGELHDVFQNLGCTMHGYVSQEGYEHEDSKSIRGDKFCALLLDAVNQEELTEERVDNWIAQLTQEGFLEEGIANVMDAMQEATTPAAVVANSPDAFFAAEEQIVEPIMNNMVAELERENALLKQQLLDPQLEDDSALLDQSIATHSSGYTPHTNAKSGKTMWTSPDGRTCYFTEGAIATATTQATGIAP